ncbi:MULTISPECIES: hypothetical protein [unclassified Crossiella]|uniref:hypothetical protein n=1 Tax=unclassified Crossiella TaxID=2620835 RepID=UPI0020001F2B|nr:MULTISPECIES: hypothetical protein [unclassified Crossiella]MCK2242539.1 hypothetical protein [Crossiella sp. S99.2]MCK2254431.1 hypothetical protein [Crossiella sp. S99.1]
MRNVTRILAAGTSALALSAGLLLTGGIASAAPAGTATAQSAEFSFSGATVLEATTKKLKLKLTSGSTVDVTLGKNTRIEGTVAVGGKVNVKGISIAGTLLASLVIGR